jgi:hypothetical protein
MVLLSNYLKIMFSGRYQIKEKQNTSYKNIEIRKERF